MSRFSNAHPVVIISFFAMVIGLTMLLMNPITLSISFVTSIFLYTFLQKDQRKRLILSYSFLFILTLLINPLISTSGETVIYEIGKREITLEASLYGTAIATMLVAALNWFSCYNKIMTADKFLYLFGKVTPTFALTLVISLRLVPTFQQQLTKISIAQRAIGMDYTQGTLVDRLQRIVRIISILLTGALENAMETATSMKARGYGLPNKTNFSIFQFTRKDAQLLSVFLLLFGLVLVGVINGSLQFSFYPYLKMSEMTLLAFLSYFSFFMLCVTPIVMEWREKLRWQLLR